MKNDTVIGLEIHIQLLTKTKLFCNCNTDYTDKKPNIYTCPVCLGLPGTLPVLNKKAVDYAIKTALALNCNINNINNFYRKNYFYPDLPKAYQISQHDLPLAKDGFLEIRNKDLNESRKIRINRVHIEEDAGKLVHLEGNGNAFGSLIDFNRSGIPLLEIVTEPDLQSSEEAILFLKELRSIVQYLEVCDGNLEKGSMRCDANISIRENINGKLGTKTELKNMNSFRAIRLAIDYELLRQRTLIEQGEKILQETRRWDETMGKTIFMRSKEDAQDYRYFPDPDLLPLSIQEEWMKNIKNDFPELPEQRRKRFMSDYQLTEYDANRLIEVKALGDYFEKAANNYKNYKQLVNWILGELLYYLGQENKNIEDSPISSTSLTELLQLIDKGTVSGKLAKNIFEQMYRTGEDAATVVKKSGFTQISDEDEINGIIDRVIKENTETVQNYLMGKDKAIHFLVGQVMRYTEGRAKPDLVLNLLQERIKKS